MNWKPAIWFPKNRALSRVKREIATLQIRMQYFPAEQQNAFWFQEATGQLERARQFLAEPDGEGAWCCFNAARRLLFNGMSQQERVAEAVIIKADSDDLSSWRRDAIKEILNDKQNPQAYQLIEATRIRDEYHANQYHKIWLAYDQLFILCVLSAIAMGLELSALARTNNTPPFPLLIFAVVPCGILGSAFSVGQSIIGMTSSAKIPEYVANHWFTIMRTLFGAITGLAGYFFYASQIVPLKLGSNANSSSSDVNNIAINLSIAFIFGYTGEKLINKIVDAIGSSNSKKSK